MADYLPPERTDIDGVLARDWAERLFEFELCEECHGDVEDHDYLIVLGHWFARCKATEENA
jgi:hypothetical protein